MPLLWQLTISPYSEKVRWALADKGVAHERRAPAPGLHMAVALWLTGGRTATLPVLELDGRAIGDSTAIIGALEERYPEPALLPPDPADRAAIRLLCARFDDLGDPYYDLMYERAADAGQRLEAALVRLDELLAERPYLSGTEFGLADTAYLPWVLRAEMRLGVEVRSRPGLAAWLDLLAARPSVREELDVVARLYPAAA